MQPLLWLSPPKSLLSRPLWLSSMQPLWLSALQL
jgi:hypothetical protein